MVKNLDSLLDGLDTIVVSSLVFLPAENMKGGSIHGWNDLTRGKGHVLVDLCFLKWARA